MLFRSEPFAIVEGDLVHIEHKSESVVLTLRGINVTQGSSISKKDSILIHSNENSYQLGNRIKVTGRAFPFERASNPGQFDAYSYYREQGYAYRILADEILLIDDSISHIPQFLQNIKEYYMEAYQMYLPENEAAILIAMVLGNKSLLEEKDRLLYQQSGMLHVLAVSGLHVSMIAMILLWLFSRLPLSFVFSRVCVVILLIGYGIVAGFSVSCIRAILMIIIRIIAQILGRCYDDLSAISVAGIVILFMNPCKLFHCDFLLSFGAVLSISCLSPYIIELLSPPKLLNGLWEGACVSLSVTLFTTPVLLYFYYEVPLYSLLLNAVVLPFVPFLFILAILLPIASGIACILGYVLAGPIHYILVLYHYLFEWSGKFFVELRLIGGPSINNILIYIILTFVLIVLLRGLKEALIKRVILVCFVCVLFGVIDVPLRAGSLTVTFLDVGQGDGIHLQMPNGDDVMIDGGSSTIGSLSKYRLQPYLRYRGVRTIKYWFLTHMDLDHCSGLKELLESSGCAIVNIENIIIPDSEECRDEFDEIFGGLVEIGRASCRDRVLRLV